VFPSYLFLFLFLSTHYKGICRVLQGLIATSRKETLQPFKKRYAHEHEPVKDLLGAIKVQG